MCTDTIRTRATRATPDSKSRVWGKIPNGRVRTSNGPSRDRDGCDGDWSNGAINALFTHAELLGVWKKWINCDKYAPLEVFIVSRRPKSAGGR